MKSIRCVYVTVVEDDQNTSFSSIATTPRCRGGRYSFPFIAPLYPWNVPYIAECFKVFGMTRSGIELKSPERLANIQSF